MPVLSRSVDTAPVAPLFAPRGQATLPAKTKRRRLRRPRSTRRAAARRAAASAAPDPSAPSQTLFAALPAWSALGASPWCLPTIRFGLFIPWAHPPPPERQAAYDLSASDLAFSQETADVWCASGTVSEVPPAVAAGLKHLAPSFVVHKGKDRLVVDLSSRNAHVADRPFRYETLPGLVAQLDAGDHLVSSDIKVAFHHIRLQAADRLLLAFRVGDRVFLPNVLPFGLKLAPSAFTKLLRPVVAALRRLGFRLISFHFATISAARPPVPARAPRPTPPLAGGRRSPCLPRSVCRCTPPRASLSGPRRSPCLGSWYTPCVAWFFCPRVASPRCWSPLAAFRRPRAFPPGGSAARRSSSFAASPCLAASPSPLLASASITFT